MNRPKLLTLIAIVTTSVGCDQATKVLARQHLADKPTASYLGDTFRLTFIENHGAFLGMGSSLPPLIRTLIFVVLVALFLAGLTYWLMRDEVRSKTAVVASSLIIGGGIGNLIDRVLFNGGVTDFLNIGIGGLRTGIFNIADVWIMAGVFLLVFSPEMREPEDDSSEEDPDDDAPTPGG